MNKSLIIFALLAAITLARFGMKDKMIENASSEQLEKMKEFAKNEKKQFEEFAKKHNVDIEKMK